MMIAALGVCLLNLAAALPAGRLDLEADELRPGLVANYRSHADPKAAAIRVEAKPAFYLGESSPHPRLPAGPFEADWSGVISIRDPGPLTFSAFVGGEATVTIDGLEVFTSRGDGGQSRIVSKNSLTREPGHYAFTVRYRSHEKVPARFQLWWEGPSFAAEPLPAWRLAHRDADRTPGVEAGERAAAGRAAVGQFGCARCHAAAFPTVSDAPPGPSLADAGRRLGKAWLLKWLENPAEVHAETRMPALFDTDRNGFVERWIVAEFLSGGGKPVVAETAGDHRKGRFAFLSLGCAACHLVPEFELKEQKPLGRISLLGLSDRFSANDLAAFLANPHVRYPDGRMPRLPLTAKETNDLAAYLLLWSKPSPALVLPEVPSDEELQASFKRRGVANAAAAAALLLREKGCTSCHTGLAEAPTRDVPIRKKDGGCMGTTRGPRFSIPAASRQAIAAYLETAVDEKHSSPFASRQFRLAQLGCVRCHQRDTDRPPILEEVGSTFGGSQLQTVPFLRTPRLTNPHQKFTRSHLSKAVNEGVTGLRAARFTYRMPVFGPEAESLVLALAEADGELPSAPEEPEPAVADPTLGTLHGSRLAGFQGYACASCHVWNGQLIGSPDPGATGPDLTRTAGRIRRDWFDRYLESPLRFHPGTPMPAVFQHGKPAPLASVLEGDPAKQKEALWAYLALGKNAPSPKPPPPVPVVTPSKGEPVLVAQIPIRFADGKVIESLSVLTSENDLLVYDLAEAGPFRFFTGGQILRNVQGRIRQFLASGNASELQERMSVQLRHCTGPECETERTFVGYDRLADGFRIRWQLRADKVVMTLDEVFRIGPDRNGRRMSREISVTGMPANVLLEVRNRVPEGWTVAAENSVGTLHTDIEKGVFTASVRQKNDDGNAAVTVRYNIPAAKPAPAWELPPVSFPDLVEGSLERPGYKAIAYPRPKTIAGEDRIMPVALAVRPRDGQVFVSSLNSGEILALRDPTDDGKNARFDNYTHGLFQDALSMLAEDDGLYVLHRRNLTKLIETKSDGKADRFDRIHQPIQGIADTYDMGYGLVRDKAGRFVYSHARHGDPTIPGASAVLRLRPGSKPEETAFGLRNPLGWAAGPEGEVFFTDNQGEWVASNKLCHVVDGRYFGYPNPARKETALLPAGKTTIWVPYGWARSINGVAYDNTAGKFGPFAGQFFMAELMFGGAIVRANVEKVNGVYQGACFPFWGKGLLGPMSVAFDPKGRLFVGSLTEPGWMAMPDRGALFRIDFTGKTPFEMQTIHARPRGFRIAFTKPVDKSTAEKIASYRLESYRYEFTGSYGSPELDRASVKVERIEVSADGGSVDLTTVPLVKDRVYMLTAEGVRSAGGESLVHPTGAYTLNEIPRNAP